MKANMAIMAAAIGCILMASPVSATALTNGSFETGDFTGWTASGNLQVTTFPGGVNAPSDGLYGVNLNGGNYSPNGKLSQSFTADIGTSYLLTFDFGKGAWGSGSAALDVKVEGLGTLLDVVVSDSTGGVPGVLSYYDFAFTADSTDLLLSFADSSSGGAIAFDGALDNVSITAIPEPSGIAMIGLVSGCAVFVRRRFMI